MEQNRLHRNNQFVRFFKIALTIFGFASPIIFISALLPSFIASPDFSIGSFLVLLPTLILLPLCTLIAAYFFTDLEVNENGLLVEFLWKKLQVPWSKVLKFKPLFGIRTKKHGIYVVVVEGLTPFHRLYGLLYGFTLKPAFVISSTITNFNILKNDIERHVKKNAKQNS